MGFRFEVRARDFPVVERSPPKPPRNCNWGLITVWPLILFFVAAAFADFAQFSFGFVLPRIGHVAGGMGLEPPHRIRLCSSSKRHLFEI